MNTLNLENFDWGGAKPEDPGRMFVTDEIFVQQAYEKFFEVEENDIVLDLGASIGPFTYSILHKNPKKVYCIEPLPSAALFNNTKDERVELHHFYVGDDSGQNIKTFKDFLNENKITHIDFFKIDCEGGEYSVFNNENFYWIIRNVRKISGEWHLWDPEMKQKFRNFRDLYLRHIPHTVYSVDGVDIKWDLWNENFIDYYTEVIITIDNR
jgi:hypothetical protein